jgi:hypothetical protein
MNSLLQHFRASSIPIPKFALSCELRNLRDTSTSMILVWFLDLKFLREFAAQLQELQIHRTSAAGGREIP